jgi:hypothetical protein
VLLRLVSNSWTFIKPFNPVDQRPEITYLEESSSAKVRTHSHDDAQCAPLLHPASRHIVDPAWASLWAFYRYCCETQEKWSNVNLLTILLTLVPELSDPASPTFGRVYELYIVSLVPCVPLKWHSLALTSTFNQLAIVHLGFQGLASLLESLSACSSKRVKRTRFRSSTRGVRDVQGALSARDWLPVLYNALHFIQNPDELAIQQYRVHAPPFRRRRCVRCPVCG